MENRNYNVQVKDIKSMAIEVTHVVEVKDFGGNADRAPSAATAR